MRIATKLTEGDIVRFNFYSFYKKWSIRILNVIMILWIIAVLIFPSIIKNSNGLIFPALFLVFLPLSVYWSARKNYKNNKRIFEQIEYVFTEDNFTMTGDSFNATMTWDKVYKVTKTKRWILIWQTSSTANVIPLKDIWDGDVHHLKEILDKKNVPNNIKY